MIVHDIAYDTFAKTIQINAIPFPWNSNSVPSVRYLAESAKWNPNKWNRATMIMVPGRRAIVEKPLPIQFRHRLKAVFQSNHVLVLPSRRCRAWLCPRMEYRIKKGKTKSHGEITAIRAITNLSNPVVSEAIGNRIMRCSLRRPFM